MNELIDRGAKIVINEWLLLKPNENLLILTDEQHKYEAEYLKKHAEIVGSDVTINLVKVTGKKVGVYYDKNEKVFDAYDDIICALDISIITTKAAKRAILLHKKIVSLPLSTNNGESMLTFNFMTENTKISKIKAKLLLKEIKGSKKVHVITDLGTDLTFRMDGRKAGFFNGNVDDGGGFSSASIEVYVPIIETMTSGTLVLDGSYGYIGKVEKPFKVIFKDGAIVDIENTPSGKKLKDYLESFDDSRIYFAGELGIGLNSKSKCDGNCYIEDESTYGTFHIGVGRNFALGGEHDADGHFDLVTYSPTMYFDNKCIVDKGKVTINEIVF